MIPVYGYLHQVQYWVPYSVLGIGSWWGPHAAYYHDHTSCLDITPLASALGSSKGCVFLRSALSSYSGGMLISMDLNNQNPLPYGFVLPCANITHVPLCCTVSLSYTILSLMRKMIIDVFAGRVCGHAAIVCQWDGGFDILIKHSIFHCMILCLREIFTQHHNT